MNDTSRIPAEVIIAVGRQLGVGHRGPKKRKSLKKLKGMNRKAALGAQLMGQRISSFSMDPIWGKLLRDKQKEK